MRPTIVAIVAALGSSGLAACSSGSSAPAAAPTPVEVFMRVAATPQETGAARAVLRNAHGIRSICLVSRSGAYREFRRLFKDQPSLIPTINASDLPESFRLTVARYADAAAIRHTAKRLHGVQSVEMPPSPAALRQLPRQLRGNWNRRVRTLRMDCAAVEFDSYK